MNWIWWSFLIDFGLSLGDQALSEGSQTQANFKMVKGENGNQQPKVSKAEERRRRRQSQRDKAAAAQSAKKWVQKPQVVTGPPRRKHMNPKAMLTTAVQGESAGMMLCRQMALPDEVHPPIRLPTQSMTKVAIATFHYPERYTVIETPSAQTSYDVAALMGYSATVGPTGAVSDYACIIYGQPSRTYIHGPFTGEEGKYQLMFPGGDLYTIDGSNTADRSYEANEPLPIMGAKLISGSPFLGLKQLPVGKAEGRSFLFITAGVRLVIAEGHNAPSAYTMTVSEYTDNNILLKRSIIDVANAATPDTTLWTCPENGYYTFTVNSFTPAQNLKDLIVCYNLEKTNNVVQIGWHMNALKDLCPADFTQADPAIGEAMRRTGCAVLISNVANEFRKQGEVIAARMPNGTFTKYNPKDLAACSELYTGQATKGSYTYMDFTVEDEAFRDCTERLSSGLWTTHYDLTQVNLVHVISFQGIYAYSTLLPRVHMSVEWMNTAQRYAIAAPAYSNADLIEARRINNSTDYFYENPVHIEDIMRWLKKGWSVARRYAGPISRGIATAFPETAPIVLPIGRYMQS